MRRWFPGSAARWGAALLLAAMVGRAEALAADDPPTRYPDVWGAVVSTDPDRTDMIGAVKRANGEVTIFYDLWRTAFGYYDDRIMSLDFFSQKTSVLDQGMFEDGSESSDFTKAAVDRIRQLPGLCCKDEIKPTETLYDYAFHDIQPNLSIAVRNADCFLCDHFVLRIGGGSRSKLAARQVIRFLQTPASYNWMDVKPYNVLYRIQTAFVHPEKYIPLDDGSVIFFSNAGVVFRMDRNGRSKFIERSSELLQLEIPLRDGVTAPGNVKAPHIGTLFPNADPTVKANCTFVPVYRTYNQIRAKQGKPRWRFAYFSVCGDPNL